MPETFGREAQGHGIRRLDATCIVEKTLTPQPTTLGRESQQSGQTTAGPRQYRLSRQPKLSVL